MKLTILLTCILAVKVSASVYSQNERINMEIRGKTVRETLKSIEKQSQFRFFYNDDFIDLDKKLNVTLENKNIEDVLAIVFDKSAVTYKVLENNFIVITPVGLQQQQKVSGVVSDAVTAEPLIGVTVTIEGTKAGTITDSQGKYSIDLPSQNAVLVFSYLGYLTQQISVNGQSTIEVKMESDVKKLEEVVVIGYGTVKKSDLSGSVGVVKSSQLDQQTNSNLATALQGKVTGVTIAAAGGEPGAGMQISIRGTGSLNNNNPLILVDDIAVSDMNNINPYDIESMQVLKDASAAAIYGSRAANGVILITTKSGKKGPMKIDANVDYGVQSVTKKLSLCNTDQWLKVFNASIATPAAQAAIAKGSLKIPAVAITPDEPVGINWQDQVFTSAPVTNLSVGMNGGADNLKYNLSIGYLKQDGIIKQTGYDRLTLKLKTDFNKGRLKIGESLLISDESRHDMPGVGGQGGNVIGSTDLMIPGYHIYDALAPGGYAGAVGGLDVWNPVAALNLLYVKDDWYKALLNVYAEVEIIKGLKFKISPGVTATEHKNINETPIFQVGSFFGNTTNTLYMRSDLTLYMQLENTLSYNRTFGKHSINAVVGYTAYDTKYSEINASKQGLPNGKWALGSGADKPQSGGFPYETTMESYLGRVIYSFDNRYIFTGTMRRDGSSRFSENNKWGNFPSASVAWNVANESFLKKLETPISELKLRASYGQLGNQEFTDYAFLGLITPAIGYAIGGTQTQTLWNGSVQTNVSIPDIKWENTATSNIGLDLGLWNNKLNFTVDAYQKTTTDLLLRIPISLSVGSGNNPYGNAGKVTNKGFELSLNYNQNIGEFKLSFTGNLSHNVNNVVSLATGTQQMQGGPATHNGPAITYVQAGHSMYYFYLMKTDGIFHSQSDINNYTFTKPDGTKVMIQPDALPGDVKFVDANHDGKIDQSTDKVDCGSPWPKFEYGFRLDGSWRFVDVSLYLQGSHGSKIYNGIATYTEAGRQICNYSTDLLNSYTFNPNSNVPRLDLIDPNGNGLDNSDRFLEDGSYLRLKSLQIGFTLPKFLSKKISVEKLRLYVGGDNLITWTKYKGYNPDIGNNGLTSYGIDFRQYPLAKSYHIGLQVNF